jgi:hypothetical protein
MRNHDKLAMARLRTKNSTKNSKSVLSGSGMYCCKKLKYNGPIKRWNTYRP